MKSRLVAVGAAATLFYLFINPIVGASCSDYYNPALVGYPDYAPGMLDECVYEPNSFCYDCIAQQEPGYIHCAEDQDGEVSRCEYYDDLEGVPDGPKIRRPTGSGPLSGSNQVRL